jgi:hypothetical protein
MVIVSLVAIDMGVLLNRGFGAIPLQLLTVIIVEVGLFRATSRDGAVRRWWIGFVVGAPAYVVVDAVFHYEIRYAFIDFCHLALVKPILLALLVAIPLPQPLFFGHLTGILQVLAAILLGVICGGLTRRLAGRRHRRTVDRQSS